MLAKVLNNVVHPQFSRLKEPAGRREDRPTRGEAQPQRQVPQRMRGRALKLMLGAAAREPRTDLLLVRGRVEAEG